MRLLISMSKANVMDANTCSRRMIRERDMFTMTRDWLHRYYGSQTPDQVEDAKKYLRTHHTIPEEQIEEWANWKHLIEYLNNTPDIVDRCATVMVEFSSELDAHRYVNLLRVPYARSYEVALKTVKPKRILELGVGGDSAISTSVFLRYCEENLNREAAIGERIGGPPYMGSELIRRQQTRPFLTSVDHNYLGMTWWRYRWYPFWEFIQSDSMEFMESVGVAARGNRYDMVFIDTSHSYKGTLAEIEKASKMTDCILMDDIFFEGNPDDEEPGGVKRAWEEWTKNNLKWSSVVLHHDYPGVGMFVK